ncbi:MAG: hypothetical protein DRJ03_11715 [Chloroflexi bacterium]|nr:MAG: hypothetical protein DRJ03_11715 [Chloroflexota bacterium]
MILLAFRLAFTKIIPAIRLDFLNSISETGVVHYRFLKILKNLYQKDQRVALIRCHLVYLRQYVVRT